MSDVVLAVENLVTHFDLSEGVVRAVDGLTFSIQRKEILTIVGESGSGKSVTALSILRLLQPPGRTKEGKVMLGDRDILRVSEKEMQSIRGTRISMIFQNPYASLHPYFRIGDQMVETIEQRGGMRGGKARERAVDLLARIHVDSPDEVLRKYPFEVSAGVCQRVMLAMALVSNPDLLIADEPTTNLDALGQMEILNLIRDMRDDLGMSVLLITHDFGVVSALADTVLVMYAGRPVEFGPADAILHDPRHPYTRGLLESAETLGQRSARLAQIPGEVADLMHLPQGCSFQPRCARAMAQCAKEPPNFPIGDRGLVRCWLYEGRRENG